MYNVIGCEAYGICDLRHWAADAARVQVPIAAAACKVDHGCIAAASPARVMAAGAAETVGVKDSHRAAGARRVYHAWSVGHHDSILHYT